MAAGRAPTGCGSSPKLRRRQWELAGPWMFSSRRETRAGSPGYSHLPVPIPRREERNDRDVVDRRSRNISADLSGATEAEKRSARKRLELATNRGPQPTSANVIRETALLPSETTPRERGCSLDRPPLERRKRDKTLAAVPLSNNVSTFRRFAARGDGAGCRCSARAGQRFASAVGQRFNVSRGWG